MRNNPYEAPVAEGGMAAGALAKLGLVEPIVARGSGLLLLVGLIGLLVWW
jgi:hypothetical protein